MPQQTRPTVGNITWATNATDVDGDPTKLTPLAPNQLTGFNKEQPVPRQWLNFFWNYFTEWTSFLSSQYPVGYVFLSTVQLTVDADFEPWDGVQANWTESGPDTVGSTTGVFQYERTADA